MSSLYTKNKEEQPNKVKTWWGGLPKKNKVIAITASSALVAGIIAGGVAISIANSQKTYAPQDAISAMLTIDGVKPASIMVAPATDTWWKMLLASTPNRVLDNVKYSTISNGAVYISTATSKGKQYTDASAVGVPTTFIVYDTPASANAAYQKLMSETAPLNTDIADSNTALVPVVEGNFLLFIPQGAFSDLDYALEAYNNVTKDDAKMKTLSNKQATWSIDFADFANILNVNSDKSQEKVYIDLVSKLGIGETTTWSGTSKDGLVWKGKFNNYAADKVATPSAISAFLGSLVTTGVDTSELPSFDSKDSPSGYDIPITAVNQAIINSCCMIISNSDSTSGSLINSDGKMISGAALGQKGFLEIAITPNTWMGIMANRTSYPFTGYETMTILINDKNGDSTITLVPFVK